MKRITQLLVVSLYFVLVTISVVIAIKPGASIFYSKQTIDNRDLVADSGFAFRYRLENSPHIFRLQKALLNEDEQRLNRTPDNLVVKTGSGSYAVSKSSEGIYYLYLSSSDNTNPITNNRNYTLYIPFAFISHQLGFIYFLILLPGVIWFLFFTFVLPEQRTELLHLPGGAFLVLDRFFSRTVAILKGYFLKTWDQMRGKRAFWFRLLTMTILSAYLYIFLEWLFFITMPSFMSIMNVAAKLKIFLLTGLVLSVICIMAIIAFTIIEVIGVLFRISRFTQYLGVLIPTLVLSVIALLLIDNFTYTVFKLGISTSGGISRALYAVLFAIIAIYIYAALLKFFGMRRKATLQQHAHNRASYLALGLLFISLFSAFAGFNQAVQSPTVTTVSDLPGTKLPNILLLGSDGVSAKNVSVYGYARDTTPVLQQLAQNSLVAENAFTNSGNSPGSVVSLFTSKLPTTTRLGFIPDILKGVDSFQHLPGILKSMGYSTYELGMPLYVDSYVFNIQNGFDIVNGRSRKSNLVGSFVQELGYQETSYFINRLTERASDRLLHILFIHKMENPYIQVTKPADKLDDPTKISQAIDIFDQSPQPWFMHIHLLGTHGDYFELQTQVFSAGEEQDQPWMTDFYDDAILSFDSYVGKVINQLKANGQFNNTILIIYTDHAMGWQVNQRIALMIHFPGDSYAGRITQNVQNLDIAPTVLDYLGVQKPDWMAGESLLSGNLDNNRLIFSAFAGKQGYDENNVWTLKQEVYKPPFYQFDYMNVINCRKWYQLDLRALSWESGNVDGSTTSCSPSDILTFEAIKQATAEQLVKDGFDVSSLP